MYNWFECKVRYDKTLDAGMIKTVTEPYLVDALSFTEAEVRILEEMKPFISSEFTVSDIKRVRFSDTFFNETGDRYYKAKLYFLTLDEKSGSEKKTAVNMLVQAKTLKEAVEIVETEMKKTMIDYSLASVTETAIIDVFKYSADSKSITEE
ncbi:MAG: DUF4494 domain-containing protein [Petrimonas sp.]|jgi:hypothetical protein|nr:MAG: hypothetical protein BWZ00_00558 [Bacteroidetes bacterium ADurb.BinA174]